MSISTPEELEALLKIGRIVATALKEMAARVAPGITTSELDRAGEEVLESHGARSAPQLCVSFPRATCISVNDEAAHGIPGDRMLTAGDLVNLDVSAELNGFFADTGASFPVPPISDQAERLCRHTRRSLARCLDSIRPGQLFNQTGLIVEEEAREGGFQVIRNLCSHGVGRWLHEEPRQIANYYDRRDRRRFKEGMVVALETFMSLSSDWVAEAEDGWALKTQDGSLAAQYEHTIVVRPEGPLIVTEA